MKKILDKLVSLLKLLIIIIIITVVFIAYLTIAIRLMILNSTIGGLFIVGVAIFLGIISDSIIEHLICRKNKKD